MCAHGKETGGNLLHRLRDRDPSPGLLALFRVVDLYLKYTEPDARKMKPNAPFYSLVQDFEFRWDLPHSLALRLAAWYYFICNTSIRRSCGERTDLEERVKQLWPKADMIYGQRLKDIKTLFKKEARVWAFQKKVGETQADEGTKRKGEYIEERKRLREKSTVKQEKEKMKQKKRRKV